jgi:hypothetical protein
MMICFQDFCNRFLLLSTLSSYALMIWYFGQNLQNAQNNFEVLIVAGCPIRHDQSYHLKMSQKGFASFVLLNICQLRYTPTILAVWMSLSTLPRFSACFTQDSYQSDRTVTG